MLKGISHTGIAVSNLDESIKLWTQDGSGASDLAAWDNMQDLLLKMGLLSAPLELEQVFINDFLPE